MKHTHCKTAKSLGLAFIVSVLFLCAGCAAGMEQKAERPTIAPGSSACSASEGMRENAASIENQRQEADAKALLEHAKILTEQLTTYCFDAQDITENSLHSNEIILRFLTSLGFYRQANAQAHPYYDFVTLETSPFLNTVIEHRTMQKIVWEVFGVEQWNVPPEEMGVGEQSNFCVMSLERGIGGFLGAEILDAFAEEKHVVVTVKITGNPEFPQPEDFGEHRIFYSIETDGEKMFLRLQEIQ